MSRIDTIRKLLEKSPDDTFLIYSLGMEHLSVDQPAEALGRFERVLALDPKYLAAYPQASKALRALGRRDDAAEMLRRGMAAAQQAGDPHAKDNMRLQLDALEGR